MRAVVQRVSRGEVRVAGAPTGQVNTGLVVLLGVATGDTTADADAVASKIAGLRVFADANGKMNLDVGAVEGSVLLISQFTLLADVGKGRRPSFVGAARPDEARTLLDRVANRLVAAGLVVEHGEFGAHMEVELVNDGPVTIVIDSVGGSIV
jgi:D-aminoacyl-tRNA deacylase